MLTNLAIDFWSVTKSSRLFLEHRVIVSRVCMLQYQREFPPGFVTRLILLAHFANREIRCAEKAICLGGDVGRISPRTS
jgi:hypothetical protein